MLSKTEAEGKMGWKWPCAPQNGPFSRVCAVQHSTGYPRMLSKEYLFWTGVRFTLRGQLKVNIQWALYCLVHNIEKILNFGRSYAMATA